jgi:hypothetical protein
LLLEVQQAVPFGLDFCLEPLEPQEAPDPDDQFRRVDGFAQNVIPFDAQGLGMDLWTFLSSQEDDGQQFAVGQLTDAAAYVQPIHVGHLDIQEHQLWLVGKEELDGIYAAPGGLYLIVAALQHVSKVLARLGIVIDHEDPGPMIGPAKK